MALLRYLMFFSSFVYVMSSQDFNFDQTDCNWCPKCSCHVYDQKYEVDCSYRNLAVVPRCQWEKVTRLRLDGNSITKISRETLEKFTVMQDLDLSNNNINLLPHLSIKLMNLSDLRLDLNKLTEVPVEFLSKIPNLEFLDLRNNLLKNLPDPNIKMANLKELGLGHNNLTEVPVAFLSRTPNLKYLFLNSNSLQGIPEKVFSHLKQLETVNMHDNNLTKIHPNFMGENTKGLLKLYISKNTRLKVIPFESIKKLKNLYKLEFDETDISEIPDLAFEGLDYLEMIKLTKHSEQSVKIGVKAFAHMRSLHTLFLTNFDLEHFPDLNGTISLRNIDLSNNKIKFLPHLSITLMNLNELRLDSNKLTEVPVEFLSKIPNLELLSLNNNNLQEIPEKMFADLQQLESLYMHANNLTRIHPNFMGENTKRLLRLDISKNTRLKVVPFESIRKLKNLKKLDFDETDVSEIPDLAFEGLDNLEMMKVTCPQGGVVKIGIRAFAHMRSLHTLILTNVALKHFPDLNGTTSIENLHLHFNDIETIPDDICDITPGLEDLDLNLNKLKKLPSLSKCHHLAILKIDHNQIRSFGNSLQGVESLLDITARGNRIQFIGENDFKGLKYLENLFLQDNEISSIHKYAFASFRRLLKLELGGNNFPELPTLGLGTITSLSIKGNSKLTKFPSPNHIPFIQDLEVYYPYHCCAFLKKLQSFNKSSEENKTKPFDIHDGDVVEEWIWLSNDSIHEDLDEGSASSPLPTVAASRDIKCKPEPDPFFPCEDLMGDWVLRCGVWIVFVLALCGNATVIIVILASHTKMDVSRFLISNLAFADLFMGIYLGFLAVVDISTLGNFKNYGVEWQLSSGCRTAGFLAVLSSELSVFTLTVITLERYIAIKNAIRVNRKLELKTAIIVMIIGWVFALVMATLPLVEVNSYGKFSVCLPFEIGDTKSIVFLVFLLCLNAAAFIVILSCYILMYCSIRGSNAWNASDFRVAKRMALLVFTDFACWAPIVFLSLTAAFGSTIVNLSQAKVLTVFVFPLNSCANPFLYAIFTSHFKKDLLAICKKVEDKYPFLKITKQRMSFSRRSSYSGAVSDNPNVYLRIRRFSVPLFVKEFQNSVSTHEKASDSSHSHKNNSETSHECNERLVTERETAV